MTTFNDIRLLSEQLSPGETLRTTCPACSGGSSGEQSFSITRDDVGIVWVCHRAKCGLTGATNSTTFAGTQSSAPPQSRPKWEGKTYPIPPKVAERIQSLWHLSELPPTWYWTTDKGGRVAMSVLSPSGAHRGWLLRSVSGAEPKALTYINEGEEGLSWYKTNPDAPTVVVEDIPSAIRAGQHVNAVALLGTGVGMSRAQEISSHSRRPIVVALDQDATDTAFRIARKYALLWGDVKVLPLKQDLKNMEEPCLRQLLTRL